VHGAAALTRDAAPVPGGGPAPDDVVAPRWPARRPLTASEERLLRVVRRVTVDDLVAQPLLLVVAVWVGSGWLWLGWAARWAALLGAVLARRAVLADRTEAGLFLLAAGHGVAGVGAVAAVPQAAPLVMLVMFGDVTYAGYAVLARRRAYFALCLANAAAVGLVSLGDWSDVADLAPPWLLVGVLAGHAVVTALVTAGIARETYTVLRERGERLRAVADRAREADREGRLAVARALASGAQRDLARLGDLAARLRAEPDPAASRAGAAAGTAAAKEALARLRVLSHGVFPEVLHQHGLVAALRVRHPSGTPAGAVRVVEEPAERLPADVESAFHAVVAAVVAASGTAPDVALRRRRGHAEMLLAGPDVDPQTLAAVTDRVEGVRGTVEVRADGERTVLHVAAPLAVPAAAGNADPQAVTMLRRFVSASTLLCLVGLVVTCLVWAVTRLASVGVIAAVLVVVLACVTAAGVAERRGRLGAALGLLCAETAFAGVVVSLTIPRFAPTAALIVMLPLTLGLPYLSRRALRLVVLGQAATVVGVVALGVADDGVVDAALLPGWVPLALLAPTVVSVGLLVVTTLTEGRAAVDAANERLQSALTELLAGIDASRRRIERDLHDGAQQHLAALAVQLHVAEQLAGRAADGDPAASGRLDRVLPRVADQVVQARDELTALVDGTFGATLRELGLDEALRRSAGRAGAAVVVTASGAGDLPDGVALTAYFVGNEAVQNATKHAGAAATVAVSVRRTGGGLEVEVRDDGAGCDADTLRAGNGVQELARRVRAAHGELTLDSRPGHGTTVRAWLPLV
jgi:signal transduction histidine kinase